MMKRVWWSSCSAATEVQLQPQLHRQRAVLFVVIQVRWVLWTFEFRCHLLRIHRRKRFSVYVWAGLECSFDLGPSQELQIHTQQQKKTRHTKQTITKNKPLSVWIYCRTPILAILGFLSVSGSANRGTSTGEVVSPGKCRNLPV